MPTPSQRANKIDFVKLKCLQNISIEFGPKPLTAIMGVNGCGKTTVLHALACCYQPYNQGASTNYIFPDFFTPNTDSRWSGSSFKLHYEHQQMGAGNLMRVYKKVATRWSPRNTTRAKRWVSYIGVRQAVPFIEELNVRSHITLAPAIRTDALANRVLAAASYVMNRQYERLTTNSRNGKQFAGVRYAGYDYSAISMGSGEQRIFKILEELYKAPEYGLILIDEIELLLHTDALKRLIQKLNEVATAKRLQIVFTSHSESMLGLRDLVNVNHIYNTRAGICVCFRDANPELLFTLTGDQVKTLRLFVEDELAKTIVYKVGSELGLRKHLSASIYGPALNCFTTAAGAVLNGTDVSNCLFVLDGDLYTTEQEKKERMNAVLTGSDFASRRKKVTALQQISQFNLPGGSGPEEYFHDMIRNAPIGVGPEQDEIIQTAQGINAVANSHDYIDAIIQRLGYERRDYKAIVDFLSTQAFWGNYTQPIRDWLSARQVVLNLL